MREVSVEEARRTLGNLVTDIANGGDPVIITKNGIQAAWLTPTPQAVTARVHRDLRAGKTGE